MEAAARSADDEVVDDSERMAREYEVEMDEVEEDDEEVLARAEHVMHTLFAGDE